jgi:hypothetical protein
MVAKVITESDYSLFAGAVAVNTCLLELLLFLSFLAFAPFALALILSGTVTVAV